MTLERLKNLCDDKSTKNSNPWKGSNTNRNVGVIEHKVFWSPNWTEKLRNTPEKKTYSFFIETWRGILKQTLLDFHNEYLKNFFRNPNIFRKENFRGFLKDNNFESNSLKIFIVKFVEEFQEELMKKVLEQPFEGFLEESLEELLQASMNKFKVFLLRFS